MSEYKELTLQNLPPNLVAFIYQYLSTKEILKLVPLCKKFRKAFQQDFLWSTLAKQNYLFLPNEGEKFPTWREYFLYLKQLQKNLSSGKPNVGFKMIPYRGHKFPISAIEIFENKKILKYTIVSGDSNGELLTWNIDEDGDKEKDVILKAKSEIIGIKNLDNDNKMFVWTKNNNFYFFEVDMLKNTEKNSTRFQLIKEFQLDIEDNPIHQIYYEEENNTIYMAPFLWDGNYKKNNIYSYNFKTLTFNHYQFNYSSRENNLINNSTNRNNNNNNNFNFNNDDDDDNINLIIPRPIRPFPRRRPLPIHILPIRFDDDRNSIYNIKETKKKNINIFTIYNDKIILYINYDPIKKQKIGNYYKDDQKLKLPNVFSFDKSTKFSENYHINLDFIINIYNFENNEIGFVGIFNNSLYLKIFTPNFINELREVCLCNEKINPPIKNITSIDIPYIKNGEMYFLINEVELNKISNLNIQQLKVENVASIKKNDKVNCVEADEFRLVIGTDENTLSVYDRTSGDLWFLLLGGSLTVKPKSFVEHPLYKSFHIVKITRNSIVGVIGNMFREYNFTFKRK